ncbi:hypothetical protein [Streptomyces avidinii]|uniref:Uncharacterized protein n=1 Tax=Streptomyces avidinii TaxID=1895 RepID=A0ABS4L4S9_STRAV|nr:hypothetical protein [Streptomyces avidinii]MBP2037097.1 hypothetical protein [Streptomyces avidinii]GGY95156.1 hypothetical protein GCM10010343_20750 [Streptomyces avidinii]
MQLLRRDLPLTLAAFVMATGCVTVRPAAPPDAPRPASVADRTPERQPTPLALPLGTLPESAGPAEPMATEPPAESVPVPASVPAAERPERPRRVEAKPPRPRRPAKRVKPAAPAKPRKRPPAAVAPRPAPQGSFDMAALCAAAEGTVSPEIVALCR